MRSFVCIVLLLCIFCTVSTDPCDSQDTCSECIRIPKCVWCAQAEYEGIRCKSNDSEIKTQCPYDLQDMSSTVKVTRNDSFTSSSENVVQIAPQNIKIKLRVGETTNFNFKYKQAENYPVDLYFLLDVTESMNKIRDVLIKQSEEIYNAMKKFTTKIRLGIGTFVDKNTFPFVQDPKKGCYSFRNQLPLTDNLTLFSKSLKNIQFIGNFDYPEGGLDALGQVLACSSGSENIIGWSPHSRKIVLFVTDDEYHAAGDGLIAGIHKPFDGKCYTGPDGKYKKELEMDYPSVAMIKKLANKMGAIIIFVAKKSVSDIYLDLADAVHGKCQEYDVQEKDAHFNKILKAVYEEKTNTITLLPKNIPKVDNMYDIDFNPDCKKGARLKSANDCTVRFYEEKSFTGSITLKHYDDAIKHFSVDVIIDGLNEKLQLDIEVISNCECEAATSEKAPQCNNNGALECGLCNCEKNWFGPYCNCTQDYDKGNDSASCKRKNDDKVCSGNGDCICGACVCQSFGNEQKYSGKYCHCDVDSCPRRNNMICSNHGRCQCGVCACDLLWTGNACDVSLLTTNCINNNLECNGRGRCYNNTCDCVELPEWDERKANVTSLCVIISDAGVHERQCKALEKVVLCTYNGKESCSGTDGITISRTQLNNSLLNKDSMWNICDGVWVEVGCYLQFSYKYHDENGTIELVVEEEANCQQNYYMYGGITFGSLLLIGLGTLIGWKILTTMRDRREYLRFINSKNYKSSIRRNVLYTSPKVTITNPTYCKD